MQQGCMEKTKLKLKQLKRFCPRCDASAYSNASAFGAPMSPSAGMCRRCGFTHNRGRLLVHRPYTIRLSSLEIHGR
jgi:hypothetical protein